MLNTLAVALGGALGSVGRYWVGIVLSKYQSGLIPIGTLSVNVIGSFIIGLVWIVLENKGDAAALHRHFLMVGLLGGFTTFSAFSLDTMGLINTGHWLAALANISANVMVCLLALAMGLFIGKGLIS